MMGLQPPAARYRMKGQGLLPHFGSNPNPFRQTAHPLTSPCEPKVAAAECTPTNQTPTPTAPAPSTPVSQATAEPGVPPVAAAALAMEPGEGDSQDFPGVAKATANPSPARLSSRAFACGPLLTRLWTPICSTISGCFRRAAKKAPVRPTRSLRQGELSLDTVRVVRNDLSDSDLEFVQPRPQSPADRQAGPARTRAGSVEPGCEPARVAESESPDAGWVSPVAAQAHQANNR